MIDTCNRWLIWVVAVLINMINFSVPVSFGALFISMMDTFHSDRATTVVVQALLLGVALGFGVVSGMLISKLGLPVVILISSILIPLGFLASFFTKDIKILYFNIGIVSAIGISMVYIATLVLTGRLFTGRQQTLCVTLHITSTGVASVIYPYLLIYLLHEYGLYGTFLILSGLTCNTFVLFVLCWTNKMHLHEKDREPLQGKSSGSNIFSNVKRLMTKSFISLLIAFAISASTLNAYLGIMLDIDAWKSRGDHKAFTLMVFHTGSIVSRLVSGLLKQKKGVNIFIYPIICTICACLGQLIVYFSNNHVMFLIGISISGLAFGGIIASSISAVVKIVHSELVPIATGLLTTLVGVLTIGAGPLFGYIRDTSGSYRNVILTVASVQAVGTVFYILALLSRRQEKNALIRNMDSCRSTEIFK